MKKAVILTGIVFVLVCITHAWGEWVTQATVAVPFEFVVGNTELPAGTYAVRMDTQMRALKLFNRDTGVSAISLTHDILLTRSTRGAANQVTLVFAFDRQRHVLRQVVVNGDNYIHDLMHGAEIAQLPGIPHT